MMNSQSSGLKIAVISEDLTEPWDEGIKKFAWSVGVALQHSHDVLFLNIDRRGFPGRAAVRVPGTRTFFSEPLRRELRRFNPDRILYVPSASATIGSFVRIYALRRLVPRARLGMAALMPRRLPPSLAPLLRRLSPPLILVPSYRSKLRFSRLSIPAELLPVGVDQAVFRPAEPGEKGGLRERYGVDWKSYVFLHVGHLSPHRNLEVLFSLLHLPRAAVLLVGSTATPDDDRLREALETGGVRVIQEAVPVEELYRLADCYVFPLEDSDGQIELPLSVIEALSCGVPVLSTPFGGLTDFLPGGPDVGYWQSEAELIEAAKALQGSNSISIRNLESFSWAGVAARLMSLLERSE
jgi:glycosyltransferase involved in cell wall biosynthesis